MSRYRPSRRDVLKTALTLPAAAALQPVARRQRHLVVAGAGAFGGWTALHLLRRGARVTLLDAWGPGNARSSSGGETRVIRTTYGDRAVYTRMAARALELWREHDRRYDRRFFRKTGALWMFGRDDSFARHSVAVLREHRLPIEQLTPAEARQRWPQIDLAGIASVLFEPEAGYLLARRACEHVVERFIAEGGEYRRAAIRPVSDEAREPAALQLEGGGSVAGEAFVIACGPWLAQLCRSGGHHVASTRQEVYYFGTPPGDARFTEDALPVWVDYRDRLFYGIPGNAYRGFKIADDTHGPRFDPTTGEREPTADGIRAARAFLGERFPALAGSPLVGAEVCQYENSPDSHFLIDRHPTMPNVWLVGGGSGHGYKMGPALGELVSSYVLGDAEPDPLFRLARFGGV